MGERARCCLRSMDAVIDGVTIFMNKILDGLRFVSKSMDCDIQEEGCLFIILKQLRFYHCHVVDHSLDGTTHLLSCFEDGVL